MPNRTLLLLTLVLAAGAVAVPAPAQEAAQPARSVHRQRQRRQGARQGPRQVEEGEDPLLRLRGAPVALLPHHRLAQGQGPQQQAEHAALRHQGDRHRPAPVQGHPEGDRREVAQADGDLTARTESPRRSRSTASRTSSTRSSTSRFAGSSAGSPGYPPRPMAWNVVIAGGGFGGFYAARTLGARPAAAQRADHARQRRQLHALHAAAAGRGGGHARAAPRRRAAARGARPLDRPAPGRRRRRRRRSATSCTCDSLDGTRRGARATTS